jgi:hypothetical protein
MLPEAWILLSKTPEVAVVGREVAGKMAIYTVQNRGTGWSRYLRGEVYGTERLNFQILGGPNVIARSINPSNPGGPIWSAHLYTVRWDHGATRVVTSSFIAQHDFMGTMPVRGILGYMSWNVIENWCPNCEEEDMIFYSEDYICAWCREHLEE